MQGYVQARNAVKGRIVMFRGVPRNAGEPIGERPAVVLRVHAGDVLDLYAFFLHDPARAVFGVPYSRDKLPNTWCWVDEQDTSVLDV